MNFDFPWPLTTEVYRAIALLFNTCSYSQKCHTTYTTDFVPEQEEKCEENFKKDCFIEYREVYNTRGSTFKGIK